MKLYDTVKRGYLKFSPGRQVGIYVCGITPYESAHLGHVFTFMAYDLLQRRLEDAGHSVRLVRNITDVDEPIYVRAAELGIPYTELAEQEIKAFRGTMDALNFKRPFAEPLASEYITPMAEAVQTLLKHGFAYHLDKNIYFDVSKFADFGKFSGFGKRLQLGLFAMRGGDPRRAGKRNPLDFLLWKAVDDPADPAQWPTELGTGRPGWHIECSVMSTQLLGTGSDIHGGGSDLIFPHHSAEIAQSFGLDQPLLAKHWVHVSPLFSDGEKMSKSLGNLVFAQDLLKKHKPAVIRLALMHYHHRIGGEWQPELLKEAERLLAALHAAAKVASRESAEVLLDRVRAALDDDINTLEVIDAFHAFAQASHDQPDPQSSGAELVAKTLDLTGHLV